MIWVILGLLGVPLWLVAIALLTLVLRNRALRSRPGDVAARLRRQGKSHWTRGHGVWVHDVFAFRGSPAAWSEALLWVKSSTTRIPTEDERRKLHRLGAHPVVATFVLVDGGRVDVACTPERVTHLLGPFVGSDVVPD